MGRFRSLVVGSALAAVLAMSVGQIHGLALANFYEERGGDNEYGEWLGGIQVDEGHEWAVAHGWAWVDDGIARADVWVSGGSVRYADQDSGYIEVETTWDWSQDWCGYVSATGDYWQIDGSWNWNLISGWQDSSVVVDTGTCIE